MSQRNLIIGVAAGVSVAFIWSGWLVLNRLAATQVLTPWDIIMMRFAIASLALSPALLLRKPFKRLGWRRAAILSIVGPATPYSALTIYGLEFAPAAHAAVVSNGLLPVITAVIAVFLVGDRLGGKRLAALGLILAGVAAIGWADFARADLEDAWKGHALFAVAAAALAIYITLCARWSVSAIDAAATIAALNCAVVLPIWLLGGFPSGFMDAPWSEIALQGLYQGLGPGVVGIILMTISITRLGAPLAGALAALVPGVTAVAAWLLLHEKLTWGEGVGVALTIAGIALSAIASRRPKASPPAPA